VIFPEFFFSCGNSVSVESGADEVAAYLGGVRHVIDKAVKVSSVLKR
jgi:hypothetical protein